MQWILSNTTGGVPSAQWGGTCRMLVVYDRENNGGIPAVQDILNDVGNLGSLVVSPLNINNRNRFWILRDKIVDLGAGALSQVTTNDFIKLHGLERIYNQSSTGASGSIQSGQLYLLMIGNTNTNAANVNFFGTSRLRFTD